MKIQMTNNSLLHIITIYFAVINVATFCTYGIDKLKAKKSMWRIREGSLLMLAVLGGSIASQGNKKDRDKWQINRNLMFL